MNIAGFERGRFVQSPEKEKIYAGLADKSGVWRRLLLHPGRKIAVLVSAGNVNETIRYDPDGKGGKRIPVAPIEVDYEAAADLIASGYLSVGSEGDGWKYCALTQ